MKDLLKSILKKVEKYKDDDNTNDKLKKVKNIDKEIDIDKEIEELNSLIHSERKNHIRSFKRKELKVEYDEQKQEKLLDQLFT